MPKNDGSVSHDKPCTLCGKSRSVLVRCQIDESGKWHFVCPGQCWKDVSGGVEDAKGFESEHPFYKYGGMWKNKHADGAMSAKKPRKVKKRQKAEAAARAAGESKGDVAMNSDHAGGQATSSSTDDQSHSSIEAQDRNSVSEMSAATI